MADTKKEPAFIPVVKAAAPASKPAQKPAAPMKRKVTFDEWWTLASNTRKLNPAMKEAVKIHMIASGFMKTGDFDSGLKHFGIKA